STDAPVVDIKAGNTTLIDDLAYGEFEGYLEVPATDLVIDIADQSGASVLLQYSAPLATLGLQDSALTVVASGFLDPANNSNSQNIFGLWVALPSGGNLIPLPLFTQSVGEVDKSFSQISVYPNPARERLNIEMNMEDPLVYVQIVDATGRLVSNTTLQGAGWQAESIDVSLLKAGLYMVQIFSDNHRHIEKVFVGR
ncbi:MAG: T9SS type A sorting domain-containing protein, partial [Bacteroidales bacterium]